jgi:hypothetical protein
LIEVQPTAPAGWYPDPTGRHESRYFDGQWTQHVSSRGVNSIDPLPAAPVPANSPIGAPGYVPYGPAAQSGPSTPPYLQSAPSTRRRSPKLKLAIAGGVVAVAVGIALGVSLSGGSGGHGFCADLRALNARYPSSAVVASDVEHNPAELSSIASQFDTLAAESPSPQDAADLRYLARWAHNAATGNYAEVEADMSQAQAAANRLDAFATGYCRSHVR